MSSKSRRIFELNRDHPLNLLALTCLAGQDINEGSELALLSLAVFWWFEGTRPNILKQLGSPAESEVESVLLFLQRAEPEAAMKFLTELGDWPALTVERLRNLDGEEVASEVMKLLAYKLSLGASLPSSGPVTP